MDNIRNTIQACFEEYPITLPLVGIGVGIFLLLACIFDWKWIFGNVNRSNYNTEKIDGLVNIFGRKTARVMVGFLAAMVIAVGIMLTIIIL